MAATEFRCKVESFRMLTPTVFELTFSPDRPLPFEAGQFISVIVPGAGPKGRDLRRAYSIASAPEQLPVELCVKLVEEGPGTNYLYGLRPGMEFRGVAPYGDFVFEPKPGRHACFISTGTGIAPFRSMVMSNHFKASLPPSATCLLGVHDESELLYMDDFAKLSDVKWVPCVSKPKTATWNGFKGRVTAYLRSLGDSFPWGQTEYYLCGGGAMIDEVKLLLAERGVAKESVHQEIYYKAPKEPAAAQPAGSVSSAPQSAG